MKKTFLLTALAVAALVSAWAEEGLQIESGGNEVKIIRYVGTSKEVVIPSRIGGHKVTAIGQESFKGCANVKKITIPEGVTEIEIEAFHSCTALTGISIPESVTGIGMWVFEECTALTDITLPDSIKKIDSGAFTNCTALKKIDLPGSVTEIGGEAFAGCKNLTGITIPESVRKIGRHAFTGTSLKKVSLPRDCKEDSESFPKECKVTRY